MSKRGDERCAPWERLCAVARLDLCGGGFLVGTAQKVFYCTRHEIKEDADHDDRRTGGDVEEVGEEETAETVDEADEHGHEHHAAKTAHEESGGELRYGEERNDQDDTDHAETTDNGERGDEGEGGFKSTRGETLGAGEVGVVGDGNDGAFEGKEEKEGACGEQSHDLQVGTRDAKDVSEKVGGEVGHEARCQVGKEDAYAHAECPDHGDGTVGTHFAATTEPVDAETADEGEGGGSDEWGKTEKSAHAHTTQGGMRHATAGDDETTGHDITTHAGTEQAAEQGAEEGILEKGVGENGKHLEKGRD